MGILALWESPTVLLLADTTVLAVVSVVAIFALCFVSLAVAMIVLGRGRGDSAPVPAPWPGPRHFAPAHEPRPMRGAARSPMHRSVEIDVPTPHVDAFVAALRGQGWVVHETGVVVATDEDEEGLTTVSIELPVLRRESSGEEIH